MMEKIKVLLLEDNPGDARLIKEFLAEARGVAFSLVWKDNLAEGLKNLSENNTDVVLLDLGLPDSPNRLATFTRTVSAAPGMPIVVLTGFDDQTFAVTTVRRGAQDYLVKGKIDTDLLVKTIRYAIARKAGGKRLFTVEELGRCDGKDGHPAYITFRNNVYDVSNSNLWKEGAHMMHLAGTDLTEALANAPHGEDILNRMPLLGRVARKATLQQELARQVESRHPHPIMVHFSVAYALTVPAFFLVWLLTRQPVFEAMSFYILLLAVIVTPVCGLSGLFSWKVTYESKRTGVFDMKIALSVLHLVLVIGTFVWRVSNPDIVAVNPAAYVYMALLIGQLAITLLLGHYGGKIVYS